MSDIKENLKKTLDEADWNLLKLHSARDALILISPELDLLEVGAKIAQDSTSEVQSWISRGLISKPTAEQLESWNATPERKFLSLVVQPYVLIQDALPVMKH